MIALVKNWVHTLPDRKRYIEVITASLTVPVLLTVIYSNITNIRSNNKTNAQEPEKVQSAQVLPQSTGLTIEIKEPPAQAFIPATKSTESASNAIPSPSPEVKECTKEVPPVELISPNENETVTTNPLCIDIAVEQGDFCSVVWSYKLNNSSWSEFTGKEICLYNVDNGAKELEVRIRSIAGSDEVILKRNFNYQGGPLSSPEVAPSASASANLSG